MSAVTPGQAAYELWAQVMGTNGVTCEPFGKLGNVEQMAWREVERQPQPAPGEVATLLADWRKTADSLKDRQGAGDARERNVLEVVIGQVEAITARPEQPAPELAALRLAVITEVREAASCNSDDGDQCERCCRHADRILAAVRGVT